MHNRKILVVEDETESREALLQILQIEGYQAVGASNGADALAHLRNSERPCVIIVDLYMPVMDGRQFISALSGSESWASIPVVVVSAVSGCSAAGLNATAIFQKPLDIDALMKLVAEYC
jgi:two-component system, chemotaxis family, chemotaxis protein CheY